MTVRLYRPGYQRKARWLLAFAVLIPGAGLLQVSGPNPVSIVASVLLAGLAVVLIMDAVRPTATVVRHGLLVRARLGGAPETIGWSEIVRIEMSHGAVGLTTLGKNIYQLHVDDRAAAFLGRMVQRSVTARRL